jgi:hypothetical protein
MTGMRVSWLHLHVTGANDRGYFEAWSNDFVLSTVSIRACAGSQPQVNHCVLPAFSFSLLHSDFDSCAIH